MIGLYVLTLTLLIHTAMICRKARQASTQDRDNINTEQTNQDANSLRPLLEALLLADSTKTAEETEGTFARGFAEGATTQLCCYAKYRVESAILRND